MCARHYERGRTGVPIRRAEATERHAYIVGEIKWFLSFDISPERICVELGYKRETLMTLLRRWDERDLAEKFSRERQEASWATEYMRAPRKSRAKKKVA